MTRQFLRLLEPRCGLWGQERFRARADFTKALDLNPDDATKAKIAEALNALMASAKAADAQSYDPSVISDPSAFGEHDHLSGSASSSYPADAIIPLYRGRASNTRRVATRPIAGRKRSAYRLVNTGARFSMKAAMPSFWSSVANSE
jgi:hypothetical protein